MLVVAALLGFSTSANGAAPTNQRDMAAAGEDITQTINSGETYFYGFNQTPTTNPPTDLDGNGAIDFHPSDEPDYDFANGLATSIGKNGASALMRTDFTNSLWRAHFNQTDTEWTVEAKINITGEGIEGSGGTFGIFHGGPDYGFDLRIGKTGFPNVESLPDLDNTGWHTYRFARVYNGPGDFEFWVWRDGALLNTELITASTSTTRSRSFAGDYSGSIGGDWEMEYLSMDPTGAYAPGPGVGVTPTVLNVVEAGVTDTYEISIIPDANEANPNPWPTALVQVTVTPDSQVLVNGSATPITLDFSVTANPNLYTQTVTVTAVDDTDVEAPIHPGMISHTMSSADTRYDGKDIVDVVAEILDDDGTPGITISKTVAFCKEGGDPNDMYQFVLTAPPAIGETVTITVNTDAQLEPIAALVFDRADWYIVQTVNIVGADDGDVEDSPHTSTIIHAVSSGDSGYDGMTVDDVLVYITDNDAQAPTATAPYAWYKAGKGVLAGDAPAGQDDIVTAWFDQSGNGRNLDQSAGGGGGIYKPGDEPALRFEGDQFIWSGPDAWGTIQQPNTIFVVGSVDTISGSRYIYDSRNGSARHILSAWGGGLWESYAGAGLRSVPIETMNRQVHTQVFNAADSSHSINSIVVGTGDIGTMDLGGFNVGSRYNGANRLIGEIDEIIVYDGALDPGEIAEIEEYLIFKWLGRIDVDFTGGSTYVIELEDPNTDSYTVSVYGERTASVDVICTPTGDATTGIDLGAGAGNAIVLTFAAGSTPKTQTITVAAMDNATSDGLREIPVQHTSSSTDTNYDNLSIDEMIVILDDNEPYCGKEPDQIYLPGDVNRDCFVNIEDIARMAIEWFKCTHPFYSEDCIQELP